MLSNIIVIMLTNYMTLLQHLNIDFLFLVSHSATVPILAHLHFLGRHKKPCVIPVHIGMCISILVYARACL